MLRQSLKSLMPDPVPTLEKLGLKPTARAEELGISEFVRIANALSRAPSKDQPSNHD